MVSLAADYLLAVALNEEVWRAMVRGKILSLRSAQALFGKYWSQGKFGFSSLFDLDSKSEFVTDSFSLMVVTILHCKNGF